jgi:paraquat-inducible protein A
VSDAPRAVALVTAREAGFVHCHGCGLLCRGVRLPAGGTARCPRCEAPLHARKPDSIVRTWCLLVAALILYVPANVLPVMTVVYFGAGEPDTIMSGVKLLFATGQPAIAVLVLIASITVPLIKLCGLAYLLLSVQCRWAWRPRDRTRLYRLIEVVGRWSMLDIFMISILVALVKLDAIATIEAGAGAVSFAAVVILTMFAAHSFDPRLIWDSLEEADEP